MKTVTYQSLEIFTSKNNHVYLENKTRALMGLNVIRAVVTFFAASVRRLID